MSSAYLELKPRTEAEVRAELLALREHQIKRQIELEQLALSWERLSILITDPAGRREALEISKHYDQRANKLRISNAAMNWLVETPLQDADREACRDRDAARA